MVLPLDLCRLVLLLRVRQNDVTTVRFCEVVYCEHDWVVVMHYLTKMVRVIRGVRHVLAVINVNLNRDIYYKTVERLFDRQDKN